MKINAKNGFDIRFIKNNTYALLVTFNDIEEDLRSAFFTVKENPEDETPILQKSLGAGISKVDDRAYKNEKKYKLQLQAEDTTPLEADVQYLYDFQVTIGNVVKTIASGLFVVSPTITGDKVITTQEIVAEVTDELDTELETTSPTAGIEYEQDPVARTIIGDMTALDTTATETVVEAINELVHDVSNNATDVANIVSGALIVGSAKFAQDANNAVDAQYAEEALNDADGNDIRTFYIKIADGDRYEDITIVNSTGGVGTIIANNILETDVLEITFSADNYGLYKYVQTVDLSGCCAIIFGVSPDFGIEVGDDIKTAVFSLGIDTNHNLYVQTVNYNDILHIWKIRRRI